MASSKPTSTGLRSRLGHRCILELPKLCFSLLGGNQSEANFQEHLCLLYWNTTGTLSAFLTSHRCKSHFLFLSRAENGEVLFRIVAIRFNPGPSCGPIQAGRSCVSKRWTRVARVFMEARRHRPFSGDRLESRQRKIAGLATRPGQILYRAFLRLLRSSSPGTGPLSR